MEDEGSQSIQRIIMRARPKADHSEYFEWQIAGVCFFVRTNDRVEAVATARAELTNRRWEFLKYLNKSTLIEERVKEQGGDVWQAYLLARERGLSVTVIPEQFAAGKDQPTLIRPARIDESFMSSVIETAGGRRVVEDDSTQANLNADYLLGNLVVELKDLQEEALEKGPHQQKLAKLFAPYALGRNDVSLDSALLSKADLRTYLDILGGPLQRHVKKASKQVKATKATLGRPDLKGGLILLNTGFGSYPHDLFAQQVERYARKDSGQFDVVISISIWMETNGFDSHVLCKFSPLESDVPEIGALRKAFDERFNTMMTDLMRGQLPPDMERASPRRAIGFTVEGLDFHWMPPRIPLPWDNEA